MLALSLAGICMVFKILLLKLLHYLKLINISEFNNVSPLSDHVMT